MARSCLACLLYKHTAGVQKMDGFEYFTAAHLAATTSMGGAQSSSILHCFFLLLLDLKPSLSVPTITGLWKVGRGYTWYSGLVVDVASYGSKGYI